MKFDLQRFAGSGILLIQKRRMRYIYEEEWNGKGYDCWFKFLNIND